MADIEWNTDKDHVLRSPLDWRDFYECHKNKSMRQTFDFSAARVRQNKFVQQKQILIISSLSHKYQGSSGLCCSQVVSPFPRACKQGNHGPLVSEACERNVSDV